MTIHSLNNKHELTDVLSRGNGIALICFLVECPICHDSILIEGGHHCGPDAVLESSVSINCYKCRNPITTDVSDVSKIKDMDFMTINELLEFQSKK